MPEQETSFYKNGFYIRQYAAFTLAANSAYSRLEEKKIDSVKHYVDLKRECFDENQSDFESVIEETVYSIRNYFSHYVHEFEEPKNKEIWLKLVQIASRRIISKGNKKFGRDEDEGEIKKILNKALSRPETLFDTNQRQPFLALILSPFLNRSELHLLIGKIYFPYLKKRMLQRSMFQRPMLKNMFYGNWQFQILQFIFFMIATRLFLHRNRSRALRF